MKLSEKQQQFTRMVADLILFAYEHGYGLTFGDAYRSPKVEYGHKNSLHRKRLAIDLNLFKDGKYLALFFVIINHHLWECADQFA